MQVTIDSHVKDYKDAMEVAALRAMEIMGIKMEKYAKALCPVGTSESTGKRGYRGGTLRNSITHMIDEDGGDLTLYLGSNVEYAPYVELGTGPNFVPPPEWEQFTATPGAGVGHGYVRPRPYLRPAVVDHADEFKAIWEGEMKKG